MMTTGTITAITSVPLSSRAPIFCTNDRSILTVTAVRRLAMRSRPGRCTDSGAGSAGFAETVTDSKGRMRKRYRLENMMTPYEKLKSLPYASTFLKPGMSFAALDAFVAATSDNEAARRMNQARARLFQSIQRRSKQAA